jgi:hypothetical protein
MTVAELIEELKKYQPEAQVQTCYDGGCYQPLEANMIRLRKSAITGVDNPNIIVLHCEW